MDYSLLLAIEKVEQEEIEGMEIIHENLEESELSKPDEYNEVDQEIEEFQRLKFCQTPKDYTPTPDLLDPAVRSNTFVSNLRHRYVSSCGKFVYHLAIIDYLQEFNWDKWTESRFKIHVLRRPKKLISAVDPDLYKERFLKFMKTEVLMDSIL